MAARSSPSPPISARARNSSRRARRRCCSASSPRTFSSRTCARNSCAITCSRCSGPRDRGTEQVLPLVQRIGPEHREHVIAHEFLAQVLDENVRGLDAEQQRLLARRLEFLALAEIGGEGDDLAAIGGLQPLQDDRGVEPARIAVSYTHLRAHETPEHLVCRL